MDKLSKEIEELLEKANNDLKEHGIQLEITPDGEGYFGLVIIDNGETEDYAQGYFENELEDLIDEAWHYELGIIKERKKYSRKNRGTSSEIKSLDTIIYEYFRVWKAFDENGKLTTRGCVATEKLISLVKDLENLGCVPPGSGRMCESQIDQICH